MSCPPKKRKAYPTAAQKARLVSFMEADSELSGGKFSASFTNIESASRWMKIGEVLNSIPGGGKKTWKEWRKTWQDMKSKTNRKTLNKNREPETVARLSTDEQELLDFKNVDFASCNRDTFASTPIKMESIHVESTMDVQLDAEDSSHSSIRESLNEPLNEQQSPPETKVFNISCKETKAKIPDSHSDRCAFNCNALVLQEQRKTQIKEDYYNIKKDYLRQKLLMMKEQTEALKGIAKGLSNFPLDST